MAERRPGRLNRHRCWSRHRRVIRSPNRSLKKVTWSAMARVQERSSPKAGLSVLQLTAHFAVGLHALRSRHGHHAYGVCSSRQAGRTGAGLRLDSGWPSVQWWRRSQDQRCYGDRSTGSEGDEKAAVAADVSGSMRCQLQAECRSPGAEAAREFAPKGVDVYVEGNVGGAQLTPPCRGMNMRGAIGVRHDCDLHGAGALRTCLPPSVIYEQGRMEVRRERLSAT
jgi:hypothetical protein